MKSEIAVCGVLTIAAALLLAAAGPAWAGPSPSVQISAAEAAAPSEADAAQQASARSFSGNGPAGEFASALPPEAARKSSLLPPLKEMISSRFGLRRMPGWLSRRGRVMRPHNGIDIRALSGWPVTAFRGGTVTAAGMQGSSGIVVEIRQQDGMIARYAHLGKALVRPGRTVNRGDPVGVVGCTGRTTGTHLHFGLQNERGVFVDPLSFLHSAEEVLSPAPDQVPATITPQQCRPQRRALPRRAQQGQRQPSPAPSPHAL